MMTATYQMGRTGIGDFSVWTDHAYPCRPLVMRCEHVHSDPSLFPSPAPLESFIMRQIEVGDPDAGRPSSQQAAETKPGLFLSEA